MPPSAILHVTSLFGGGVDRHVRDIVRGLARPQFIWHADEGVDVIEDTAAHRFHALRSEVLPDGSGALATWLRSRGVGLVHLHSVDRAPRERARWLREALALPQVATLHDLLFLRPDVFAADDPFAADESWLAQTAAALLASRAVFAPSSWLARLAAERIPGLAVEVVANGSRAGAGVTPIAPRAEFAQHRARRVVALVGALGPHKGAGLLDDIASALEGSEACLVVIGYYDRQYHAGWRVPGRLFVHGAFAQGDAPGLLLGYGACLALFPNRFPESFSYALSDAWTAGVPVLAAAQGALADRIAAHGGGWLLPGRFDAAFVAGEIRALAGGEREAERARVQSRLSTPDPARVPDLDAMTRSLDAFYARYGLAPGAGASADDAAIQALLATNLDGALFRQELVRLTDELAQTLAGLEDTKARAGAFEREARGWIAKLEADVKAVQAQMRLATQESDRLRLEADTLRLHREALERLPSLLRRLLLKWAFDARR